MLAYVYWSATRFDFRDNPGVFVFGDSSGHSVMTKGLRLAPEEVLLWQIASVHAGAILDFPPFADDVTGHNIPWDTALTNTCTNVARALPHYLPCRDNPDEVFRWWGVLQGRTWDEMYEWWQRVAEVYPFVEEGEGWAFNPLGGISLSTIACSMGFLVKHGLKYVHALGTGGVPQVGVLLALGVLGGFEWVSFDSSNPIQYAANNKLFLPPASTGVATGTAAGPATFPAQQRCTCPACTAYRVERETDALPTRGRLTYETFRREQHNVVTVQRAFDAIYAACKDDPEGFLRKTYPAEYGAIMRGYEHGHRTDLHRLGPKETGTSLLDFIGDG
jgi:hypothetical protein